MEINLGWEWWEFVLMLAAWKAVQYTGRSLKRRWSVNGKEVYVHAIRGCHDVEVQARLGEMQSQGMDTHGVENETGKRRSIECVVENRSGRAIIGTKIRVEGKGVDALPWTMVGGPQGYIEGGQSASAGQPVIFVLTEELAEQYEVNPDHLEKLTIVCQYIHENEVYRRGTEFEYGGG